MKSVTFARIDVAMTSMATGSKVPSIHTIPRIPDITSSPTPPPEAVTLQILCALSLISFGVIYVCEWKSWSNILLGKEISPRAKYMNQSTSHPSTNYLNRSNQVGGAPGPWCPVARAGALLLTEPTVWSRIQIWTQLQFIVSSVACKDTACTNFIFNIGEMFLDVLTCLSGHHKCLNDQGNMFMSSINIYFEFPFLDFRSGLCKYLWNTLWFLDVHPILDSFDFTSL